MKLQFCGPVIPNGFVDKCEAMFSNGFWRFALSMSKREATGNAVSQFYII